MSIISIDKNIIKTINNASKYKSINKIGIFGSYAKGENDNTSDIDILYDYDEDDEQSTDNILDFVDEVDQQLKKISGVLNIDYVWYNGVLKSTNIEFKNKVLSEVIWIYEKSFS